MKIKRKILCLITAFCLAAVTAVPMIPEVYADDTVTEYLLWVGGVQVTDANKDDITSAINKEEPGTASGSAAYDPNSNTLTLENFTYTGMGHEGEVDGNDFNVYAAIFSGDDNSYETTLELYLTGKNTVGQSGNADGASAGVYVPSGNIEVSGSGSLVATGGSAKNFSNGVGIRAGDIEISEGSLTGIGDGDSTGCYGVYAGGVTVSDNASLEGIGADTEAYSCGVYAEAVTVSGGSLTGNSGSTEDVSFGVEATEVKVSGGSLTGIGKDAMYSAGVLGYWGITVSDGSLTGIAGDATGNGCGVYTSAEDEGVVELSGGVITAQGPKAFEATPTVDETFTTAKAWYGTSETNAETNGAQLIDSLSSNYNQKYVRIAPHHSFTFYANGGVFADSSTEKTVATDMYGDKDIPDDPTLTDHTFSGWFDEKDGGNKVTDFTEGKTVYAQWEGHSYTLENASDATLKTPGTCTTAAVYYKSCTCGKLSTDTFTGSVTEEHSWGAWSKVDEQQHSRTCETDESHKETVAHTESKAATCTEKAFCNDCNESYGTEAEHSYTEETVKPEALKTAATCTAAAVYYKSCICGKVGTSSSDTFKNGSALGHKWDSGKVTKATTCTAAGVKTYTCANGGCTKTEAISALGHKYGAYVTTKKAGFGTDGKQVSTCSGCKATKSKTIAKVKTPVLSATSYTFNNKAKTPIVTVKDTAGMKVAISATYASGRKNVGKYAVKVKLTGANYSGTKTVYFKINPKGVSVSKLTKAKKSFTVKWKKPTATYRKQMTGYQIRYSTSSKMTSPKTVTVKSTTATSKTIKKLKANKKYYVQIRTYKTVKGVNYYSGWSKAKSVKTK